MNRKLSLVKNLKFSNNNIDFMSRSLLLLEAKNHTLFPQLNLTSGLSAISMDTYMLNFTHPRALTL